MLGKGKTEKEDREPSAMPVSDDEKTIIGEKISIEGSIQGKEDLLIEGAVKGNIELEEHHLTVGTKGQVEGEVHADSVTISGRLTGNIKALGKVQITKEADFSGEIKARNLSVEDGAYLKAVIELEPKKKAAPIGKLPDKMPEQKVAEEKKPPVTFSGEAKGGADS